MLRSIRIRGLGDRAYRRLAAQKIKRIGQLEVVVFLARSSVNDLGRLFLGTAFSIQVARQIGFGRTLDLGRCVFIALRDRNIGRDAQRLNRMTRRRVVARRGEP